MAWKGLAWHIYIPRKAADPGKSGIGLWNVFMVRLRSVRLGILKSTYSPKRKLSTRIQGRTSSMRVNKMAKSCLGLGTIFGGTNPILLTFTYSNFFRGTSINPPVFRTRCIVFQKQPLDCDPVNEWPVWFPTNSSSFINLFSSLPHMDAKVVQ